MGKGILKRPKTLYHDRQRWMADWGKDFHHEQNIYNDLTGKGFIQDSYKSMRKKTKYSMQKWARYKMASYIRGNLNG